ncbi:CK1/CK1 protein kinase [Edhazardia aedis USNM 41457]|uniref:non-specific serine/threonine protein kinase n=1 Tax=Edhazardia aedis (strain USNM 41457) TaxID=1003232 RepID=J8ZPE3_EDHAE|nr:CK1/CK1 protein kinase [Edhazardia aedis USNM 41457]|eukprot:EJW01548.1 CK1/CK1 protein kinase [Edhazardia aedis USNM 41457]
MNCKNSMKQDIKELEKHIDYKFKHRIGKGSFGTVYQVADSKNRTFALKIEETNLLQVSQLENEYKVYVKMQGNEGVPKVYYHGEKGNIKYIIMELLDTSLSDILEKGEQFHLKTISLIGRKLICIIENLHRNHYLYRDMKPENIMTKKGEIFLIDYGMCKKYIVNGEHIPFIKGKVLTGTARYTSINTHKGYEQSRRDDLEGIAYVLIYLIKGGELPWMGIPAPSRKEKYAKIGMRKEEVSINDLCDGIEGKEFFIEYLEYVRKLGFYENPDYEKCKGIFIKMLALSKNKKSVNSNTNNKASNEILDAITQKKAKKKGFFHKIKKFFSYCSPDSKTRDE